MDDNNKGIGVEWDLLACKLTVFFSNRGSSAPQLLFCIELVATFSRLTRKCKALDEASGLFLWVPKCPEKLFFFPHERELLPTSQAVREEPLGVLDLEELSQFSSRNSMVHLKHEIRTPAPTQTTEVSANTKYQRGLTTSA